MAWAGVQHLTSAGHRRGRGVSTPGRGGRMHDTRVGREAALPCPALQVDLSALGDLFCPAPACPALPCPAGGPVSHVCSARQDAYTAAPPERAPRLPPTPPCCWLVESQGSTLQYTTSTSTSTSSTALTCVASHWCDSFSLGGEHEPKRQMRCCIAEDGTVAVAVAVGVEAAVVVAVAVETAVAVAE